MGHPLAKGALCVIVPAYNVASTLPRCVESLLAQTHPPGEIVLVDDGSTDGTGALCDAFAREHAAIKVFHNANQGLAKTRRFGVQHTGAAYIGFVDGDDCVHPGMYAALINTLEAFGADIACCGVSMLPPGKAVPAAAEMPPPRNIRPLPPGDALAALLRDERVQMSVCNKLYRAALFRGLAWNTRFTFHEDLLLNARLLQRANQMAVFSTPLYYYCLRPGSLSQRALTGAAVLEMLEAVKSLWGLEGAPPAFTRLFHSYYREKLIYLYTNMQRGGPATRKALRATAAGVRAEIRRQLGAVLGDGDLPRYYKPAALAICAVPGLYRLAARCTRPVIRSG